MGPRYSQEHSRGHLPTRLERMLLVYFLQQWFNLADEALEVTVHASWPYAHFVHWSAQRRGAGATLLPKFRRLPEANKVAARLLERGNAHLKERRLLLSEDIMVDATIVAAPSSTKNAGKARDSKMHQTKKGNQWYFRMKARLGADLLSGAVHSFHCTAADVVVDAVQD